MKVYLACAYSHPDVAIRVKRFNEINVVAAKLMNKGYVVFSPISHSHPVEATGWLKKKDWEFWKRQDEPLLDWADQLWVYTSSGWLDSVGVQCELEMARAKGKPVKFIGPKDIDKVEECLIS